MCSLCSLTRGVFWYKIYDVGPEKVFTVHSRGVFTQDKSSYFSNSKVYGKNGTGEKVFTIKRCSLIRGVHYERFHCIACNCCLSLDVGLILASNSEIIYTWFYCKIMFKFYCVDWFSVSLDVIIVVNY